MFYLKFVQAFLRYEIKAKIWLSKTETTLSIRVLLIHFSFLLKHTQDNNKKKKNLHDHVSQYNGNVTLRTILRLQTWFWWRFMSQKLNHTQRIILNNCWWELQSIFVRNKFVCEASLQLFSVKFPNTVDRTIFP